MITYQQRSQLYVYLRSLTTGASGVSGEICVIIMKTEYLTLMVEPLIYYVHIICTINQDRRRMKLFV